MLETVQPHGGAPLSSNVREKMACNLCSFPDRFAHGVIGNPIKQLKPIKSNSWFETLTDCPECRQLWFTISYEPWSGHPHSVAWKWNIEDWDQFDDPEKVEDHNRLYSWHVAELFRYRDSLKTEAELSLAELEGFLTGAIRREDASHELETQLTRQREQGGEPDS